MKSIKRKRLAEDAKQPEKDQRTIEIAKQPEKDQRTIEIAKQPEKDQRTIEISKQPEERVETASNRKVEITHKLETPSHVQVEGPSTHKTPSNLQVEKPSTHKSQKPTSRNVQKVEQSTVEMILSSEDSNSFYLQNGQLFYVHKDLSPSVLMNFYDGKQQNVNVDTTSHLSDVPVSEQGSESSQELSLMEVEPEPPSPMGELTIPKMRSTSLETNVNDDTVITFYNFEKKPIKFNISAPEFVPLAGKDGKSNL
jgi:hypothetical protein